jgi:hypothetical protein
MIHATPPRFGTEPIEEDDLFALIAQTCADCGATFEASRRSARCATCASLRTGQVGPATVRCPVCDLEHAVPLLSETKLCAPCRVDLVMTLASARARRENAQAAADAAWSRLDAALGHADDRDRDRYDAARTLAETGSLNGRSYTEAQRTAAWQRALERGDGLSALLAAWDAWGAAAAALDRARAAMAAVEEASAP